MKPRRLPAILLAAALVTTIAAKDSRAESFDSQRLIGTLVGAGLGGLAGSAIGKGTGNKVAIGAGTFVGAVLGNRMSVNGLGGGHASTAYVPANPVVYEEYRRPGHPRGNHYRNRHYRNGHYRHGHKHRSRGYGHYKHRRTRYVVRERYVVVPQAYTPPAAYPPPPDARYCREYRTDGRIGGAQQPLYGKACLQADGSWQIVE